MSEKELGSVQVGAEPSPGQPAAEKSAKRGCFRRFWWIIPVVIVIVVVIVVPIVILVAVPKIAQKKIDQAKLNIDGVKMYDTRADSFKIEINSTITTDGSIKANIDGFEGILYLTDVGSQEPFMKLDFPATTADKHQTVQVSQAVNITDHSAFERFTTWFFDNDTLSISLEGKTKVKAKSLPKKIDVNFQKTMIIKGLNAFKNSTVSNGAISLTPAADGTNFKAESHIPDQSNFSLEIGNTTFANSINGTPIGNLTIENLVVNPGINDYPVTADLDQAAVLTLMTAPPFCSGGDVPVTLSGYSAVNRGEHLVYFEKALQSASQTVQMDIISIIRDSLNITITCPTSKN